MKITRARKAPVARVGLAVEQKTAYDFLQQGWECQGGYCDLVAAPAGIVARISPSDPELSQFVHETDPEKYK